MGMVVGEEEDDDVAFTDAPEAVAGLPSEGAPEGDPNTPALPILPPLAEGGPAAKREDMERVVRLIQRRDHHGIFKDPVTEDVAPGYFKVIQEPMDFTTMRGKLERGEYLTYEDLQRDLRLMFLNAMTYNPAGSPFYSHARAMLFSAEKLVEQARQGVLSQRQAAGEARKHNAQLRAQERAQRDALRAAARAEQRAAQVLLAVPCMLCPAGCCLVQPPHPCPVLASGCTPPHQCRGHVWVMVRAAEAVGCSKADLTDTSCTLAQAQSGAHMH